MTIKPPIKTEMEILKTTRIKGGDIKLVRGIDGSLFTVTRIGDKITVQMVDEKR